MLVAGRLVMALKVLSTQVDCDRGRLLIQAFKRLLRHPLEELEQSLRRPYHGSNVYLINLNNII